MRASELVSPGKREGRQQQITWLIPEEDAKEEIEWYGLQYDDDQQCRRMNRLSPEVTDRPVQRGCDEESTEKMHQCAVHFWSGASAAADASTSAQHRHSLLFH